MEWISIEDGLPEIDENVLIYGESIGIICSFYIKDKNDKLKIWYVYDGGESNMAIPFSRVTHWMPLPELPKEK